METVAGEKTRGDERHVYVFTSFRVSIEMLCLVKRKKRHSSRSCLATEKTTLRKIDLSPRHFYLDGERTKRRGEEEKEPKRERWETGKNMKLRKSVQSEVLSIDRLPFSLLRRSPRYLYTHIQGYIHIYIYISISKEREKDRQV